MQNFLIELLGWMGVLSILGAYLLLTMGELQGDDVLYLFLNVFGSVAILIDAWKDRNYQPVALNIVWGLIAVIGLVNVLL